MATIIFIFKPAIKNHNIWSFQALHLTLILVIKQLTHDFRCDRILLAVVCMCTFWPWEHLCFTTWIHIEWRVDIWNLLIVFIFIHWLIIQIISNFKRISWFLNNVVVFIFDHDLLDWNLMGLSEFKPCIEWSNVTVSNSISFFCVFLLLWQVLVSSFSASTVFWIINELFSNRKWFWHEVFMIRILWIWTWIAITPSIGCLLDQVEWQRKRIHRLVITHAWLLLEDGWTKVFRLGLHYMWFHFRFWIGFNSSLVIFQIQVFNIAIQNHRTNIIWKTRHKVSWWCQHMSHIAWFSNKWWLPGSFCNLSYLRNLTFQRYRLMIKLLEEWLFIFKSDELLLLVRHLILLGLIIKLIILLDRVIIVWKLRNLTL